MPRVKGGEKWDRNNRSETEKAPGNDGVGCPPLFSPSVFGVKGGLTYGCGPVFAQSPCKKRVIPKKKSQVHFNKGKWKDIHNMYVVQIAEKCKKTRCST
jgi:hypothetical protein